MRRATSGGRSVAAGDVWGNSWLNSWASSWRTAVAPVIEERRPTLGNFRWDKSKKRNRVIRFSDLDEREKLEKQLAAAALPIVDVPIDRTIDEWEDEEDDIVIFALLRMLD